MSNPSKFQIELLPPLWRKLVTVTVATSLWIGVYQISSRLGVWLLSNSFREIVFEAALRLLFTACAGFVLGTFLTAVCIPFLWLDGLRGRFRTRQVTCVVAWLVLAVSGGLVLTIFARWAKPAFGILTYPPSIVIVVGLLYVLVIGGALVVPRSRRRVIQALESASGPASARRSVIVTGVAAAIAGSEWCLQRGIPGSLARTLPSRSSSPNVLLITFDALGAEELSIHGNTRPTSPALAAFAQTASVFDNYFSVSTFTTPCIATMMTGRYPCESHRD